VPDSIIRPGTDASKKYPHLLITLPYEKSIGVAVLVSGAAILAFVLYKIYGRSKAKANLGNIQK
jgi:hypothetical protein